MSQIGKGETGKSFRNELDRNSSYKFNVLSHKKKVLLYYQRYFIFGDQYYRKRCCTASKYFSINRQYCAVYTGTFTLNIANKTLWSSMIESVHTLYFLQFGKLLNLHCFFFPVPNAMFHLPCFVCPFSDYGFECPVLYDYSSLKYFKIFWPVAYVCFTFVCPASYVLFTVSYALFCTTTVV